MIERLADDLRPEKFTSLPPLISRFCVEHADLPAFTSFDRTLTYREVDELSDRFANYLTTETNLKPGDRIAIQWPNILQFPLVFYGVTRAGFLEAETQ